MTVENDAEIQIKKIRGEHKPREYRCRNNIILKSGELRGCGRFLMRAVLPVGSYVEIRCPKCGRITILRHETLESEQPVISLPAQ